MADFILPPWLRTAGVTFRYLDATGISRGEFGGPPRTASRGGDRLGATLEFTPQGISTAEAARERRALIALLGRLQGRQNRLTLTNPARRLAGSFPAAELFTNNTFSNGTTGWTDDGECQLTVQDRVMRITALRGGSALEWYQGVTLTLNVPYALRSFVVEGRGSSAVNIGPSMTLGHGSSQDYSVVRGLRTVVGVPTANNQNQFPAVVSSASGFMAGDYFEVPYCSFARCALVDNSPNAFQRSDEIDNAYWTKSGCTVNANFHTAPDGTATAERVVEDTSTGAHYFLRDETRTSQAEDWCVAGMFARSAGTRDVRLVIGRDGSNYSLCTFDLGGGTAGSPSNVGDNTNARAFIASMGNGYYYCALVARLAASTNVRSEADFINAGNSSYTGDGTSALAVWRFGAARSSVPIRLAQTTSAATTGTAQTGTALHIKGLPASTNGLLLPGDEFEIITSFGSELKIATAPLNSDAAGLGHVKFFPPVRGVLSDGAAFIVNEPMGYFLFSGDLVGWDHAPGIITTASVELEEAA